MTFWLAEPKLKTLSVLMNERLPVIIIADRIRSLYNVGSLFRLADGVSLEALYLCGFTGYPKVANDPRPEWIAERNDREIRKTGLSGVDAVPFRHFPTTAAAVKEAKDLGYQLVALELTDNSIDYRQANYQFPLAIIIGHETEGVDPEVLAVCDQIVHLPMRGQGVSLNVSTAAAALLYHVLHEYEQQSG